MRVMNCIGAFALVAAVAAFAATAVTGAGQSAEATDPAGEVGKYLVILRTVLRRVRGHVQREPVPGRDGHPVAIDLDPRAVCPHHPPCDIGGRLATRQTPMEIHHQRPGC